MGSCYPAYPLPAPAITDANELWYPGSPSYASPPRQEQTELARLRYKQELQRIYENTPESSYDLSLKDIVDPVITVSGNPMADAAQEDVTPHAQGLSDGKNKSWKTAPIAKLLFSFYFPGFSAKLKRSPSYDTRASSALKQCLKANISTSRFSKGSPEATASSSSKIHPSNQCSSCSSFTVFFKTRCFVCGRLYCSICAKECMDSLSSGFKCKGTCKNDPLKRRFSQKMASSCWPGWSNSNVPRPKPKHKAMDTHCMQRFLI